MGRSRTMTTFLPIIRKILRSELYVADGYGNHRVIVFDAETGKYKRHWGAYGKKPNDDNVPPYNPKDPQIGAVRSRRLRQSSGHRLRRGDWEVQAALGGVWEEAER